MRRFFLDSSAMFKLVDQEPESSALRRHVAGSELVMSELSRVEVRRAALRAGVSAQVAPALNGVFGLSIDELIIQRAGELRPDDLRSLDAIQLATALRVQHDIDAVICYDRRLADACEQNGLRVERPA